MVSFIKVDNTQETEGLEEKNKFYFEQVMFMEPVRNSQRGSQCCLVYLSIRAECTQQTHRVVSSSLLTSAPPCVTQASTNLYYGTGTFHDQ